MAQFDSSTPQTGGVLKVSLVTLGDPARLTGGYLYHRRMADFAPQLGARVRFVSFPDRSFPLGALAGPRVFGSATVRRSDAIVLDSICAAQAAPYLAARGAPKPLLGMLHQPPGGIDFGPIRERAQALLDRLAYRSARLLMVASEALADELVATGFDRAGLRVVPPGRDVATTVQPAGDLRRGRRAALLCVGNWMERKGILTLLDAFAELPHAAATLHLVGDTRVEPRYARRVRRRLSQPDLEGRVVVHGPVSTARVAGLYQAADVFVLPSLKEPFGTVYGEAMAFGLPVVGWRAGNLPHLADDGVEGFVLPPGDVQGLTAALHRLCEDQTLRRRLGEAARRRAEGRPTWQQSAELFFGTIREAIAMEGGR